VSHVTNVILTFPLGEEQALAVLNERLACKGYERRVWFRPFDSDGTEDGELYNRDVSTGTKRLETNVCLAAFNYLNIPDLVAEVRAAPWAEPEYVQLFVQDEHENRFTDLLTKEPGV